MTATRGRVLLLWLVVGLVAGYLVGELAYSGLPPLPRYLPATLVLLALVELGMARVVRDRVHRVSRRRARALHPLQVARAVALAKASSPTGSLLLGFYGGLLGWLLRVRAGQAHDDAVVCAFSAGSALLLVGAALVLERACRTPDHDDSRDGPGLGSRL